MGLFFGTDGIRGVVGQDLTYELAIKCGNALSKLGGKKIIIGQDTRSSGQMIKSAFVLGANLGGADVIDIGMATTPAISYLTKKLGQDYGVVISASHNPPEYNGIKIFDSLGRKLSTKTEEIIERKIIGSMQYNYCGLGKTTICPGLIKHYEKFLCSSCRNLSGLTVALDCANGASRLIAKKIFTRLGAKVYATGTKNSQINVNCGATCPQNIATLTKKVKADIGFSFDGDADRIVVVDSSGKIYNGDNILYCLSKHYHPKTVVGTTLSNMGLESALSSFGVKLERADVGDKFVLEKMQKLGVMLGGEQSGHIIASNYVNTGDGLLVALLISSIFVSNKKSIYSLMNFFAYPQVMYSVVVEDKLRTMGSAQLTDAISYATNELAGRGRVLVRPSGTEQKIRVMVEAEDKTRAFALAEYIVSQIEKKEALCAE